MGRNIEIKARVSDPETVRGLAEEMADRPVVVLEQSDTFYHTDNGRLKLRRIAGGGAELIWYRRPDAADPAPSDYVIAAVTDPKAVDRALAAARGRRGTVRKRRLLLLCGRTRIHLDRVEGLGDFLELEVVLAPGEDQGEGRREAERLMSALRIEESELVAAAYVDLLAGDGRAGGAAARVGA